MRKGIEIERETLGSARGRTVRRGDTVTIRYQLFLNHGDQVGQGEETFTLGERHIIAGLEYGIEGMLVGGQRWPAPGLSRRRRTGHNPTARGADL